MESKFKEWLRVIKFTIISISAGIIQVLLFSLLNELLKWDYWFSYLISLLASILWNFTINRKVTFKSANNVTIAMLLVLGFYVAFTPLSTILGQYAESKGVNEYIVLGLTMISNFVLEFLYTRYIVYRNSCDTLKVKGENFKKKPLFFRVIVWMIKIFYKERKIEGIQNIPSNPCIIISNHAQMNGPLTCQFYFPTDRLIWCNGEMMNIKEVPAYAYKDFWSYKSKWVKWFYKILSYVIAPISSYIFTRADTIAVYKDARLISTFRSTINGLNKGKNIIIFPECSETYNEIVNEFQNRFVNVAKMYYDKYGKIISFVPMYNAAALKLIVFGKPIEYNPDIDVEKQREMICNYLKEEITKLAKSLPKHKVVPYSNVRKKNYPYSK